MDFPKRKQIRLQDYGYSAPGAYFVTVCTQDRRCILSEIRRGDLWSPADMGSRPTNRRPKAAPTEAETSSSLRRGDLCVARMSP